MNTKLKSLVTKLSLNHSPFKRELDNKLYQEKYIEIFTFIIENLPDLNSSVHIKQTVFQKLYRNYKSVLFDLYNDGLIYFYVSKSGSLIHGNAGFSRELRGNYEHCFSSFYKLDSGLIQAINSGSNLSPKSRLINKSIEHIYEYNNRNNTRINNEYKEIKITPNEENVTKLTENKWYKYLTYEDGRKVMETLPHYGSYIDGRIYSKFHSMKRELRKHLLLCGGKIKEVFDISHCFPTLLGVIIEGKLNDDDKVQDYRNYIMNNDIYSDALESAGIERTIFNRNKIKPYFNKFILSTIKDNKRNMKWEDKYNDPKLFSAVVNFFKNKFPEVFDLIWNYETTVKRINGKNKRVKTLAHDLQRVEKIIIDQLTAKLKDIPYLTLHDAIYIKEDDFSKIDFLFEDEFKKILNF